MVSNTPYKTKATDNIFLFSILLILMCVPVIIGFVRHIYHAKQGGWQHQQIVPIPEISTVMTWEDEQINGIGTQRHRIYYFFDDERVCFQRRTGSQLEPASDCNSFEDYDPEKLAQIKTVYEQSLLQPLQKQIIKQDTLIRPEFDIVQFYKRTQIKDIGYESRFTEFNFRTKRRCVQRWVGALIDSYTYCSNFEELAPASIHKAKNLLTKKL